MFRGIDCASRLDAKTAARAKAAGFDFVGRYLVPETYGKALVYPEVEAITGAGLRILSVFETTADRARSGAAGGGLDGFTACQRALALKMPKSGIIYFAVDYDAGASDFPLIAEYLKAARAQTGSYNVGVYGSFRVIEAMAQRGVCRGFWQCVAWSYGQKSEFRTVYQSDWSGTSSALAAKAAIGVPVDLNECADLDKAGIWNWEEYTMTGKDILDKLSDADCYALLQKAQRHAAALPAPDWARKELAYAKSAGINDGTQPLALCTRTEAAIMAARASIPDGR